MERGVAADPRQATVLVVDDDAAVRSMVRWQLEADHHDVVECTHGDAALDRIDAGGIDLVVLDLGMPGTSGLDVLRSVRGGRSGSVELPVIILSGHNGESDRVTGLDLGADDYLVKPFSPAELGARVRSVLRRSAKFAADPTVRVGPLRIDVASRAVTVTDEPVPLTAREFDLLLFLAQRAGDVFNRRQLMTQVWQASPEWLGEATVTEHVHRVRGKLQARGAAHLLRTVRGVGYVLSDET